MTPCRLSFRAPVPSVLLVLCVLVSISLPAAATVKPSYYGHETVTDAHGVIAPWYHGLNGQCDWRVRIAAETLKRYPWTSVSNGVPAWPHYVFNGSWKIDTNGVITPAPLKDWDNGDIGQRATSVLNGFVDYYRYSGDAAAIAHLTYMADFLVDWCVTPPEHPWPGVFISVPVKGKPYGRCDPNGMIQLDLVACTGQALLRAYQVTGNRRWLATAQHWGNLLAEHCNLDPTADPWPRYVNSEASPWKDNKQTGGVTMILGFLEELLRVTETIESKPTRAGDGFPLPFGRGEGQGEGTTSGAEAAPFRPSPLTSALSPSVGDRETSARSRLIAARVAGERYLRDKLLPAWAVDDTWGRYFWDWANPVQNCLTTPDAARYLLDHPTHFPNWRTDARNILSVFFNRTSVAPESGGDVYNGAWAYPESSSCCGRSLWYAPLDLAPVFAQYAVLADSAWARELALRQIVLQTYDGHENGQTEDNLDGGVIVNGSWFNIAHPMPLRFLLAAMAWLPEELGASRENHIMRSSAVVTSVVYGPGRIEYTTFDAPPKTVDVLRLAFAPKEIQADDRSLRARRDLKANGYTLKRLPNGDTLVTIRHDGAKRVVVTGKDPLRVVDDAALDFSGDWHEEIELVGSSRCDDLARVQRAKGIVQESTNAKSRSAPDTARGHRSAMTLPNSEPGFNGRCHVADIAGATVTSHFDGNQLRLIGRTDPSGGLADVFLDDEKQLVPIDCWNPLPRRQQVLHYRNGLAEGPHTLKIMARGAQNPYASGTRVYVEGVQFSAATGAHHFPSGPGPTETQRMIFGYTGRTDWRDSHGHAWRPATEFVTRLTGGADAVARCWWTNATNEPIRGTPDPELYRYGVQATDFWVNVTVGPGKYHARLKFAATRGQQTGKNRFDISVNGRRVVERFDVCATAVGSSRCDDLARVQRAKRISPEGADANTRSTPDTARGHRSAMTLPAAESGLDMHATAGGLDRAVDLVFNDLEPRNGIIEVHLTGAERLEAGKPVRGEAFLQALEIGLGNGGGGAKPVSFLEQ